MTTPLSRRRHLAARGACATVLAAVVFVLPSVLGLGWRSPDTAFWTAILCAAACMGWPPLARRRQGPLAEGGEEPPWAVIVTGAWFAACVLVPSLVLGFPAARFSDLVLGAAAVGLSAAVATTTAAWRPGYAVLALATAVALVLMGPSKLGFRGATDARTPPGLSGAAAQEVGQLRPVSIVVEGAGVHEVGLVGYPPLLIHSDWLAGEKRAVRAWMVGPESQSDWELFTRETLAPGAITLLPGAGDYSAPSWAIRGGASLKVPGDGWPLLGLIVVLVGLVGCVAVQRAGSLGPASRAGAHGVIAAGALLGIGVLTDGVDRPAGVDGTEPSSVVVVMEGQRFLDGGTAWVRIQRAFGVLNWVVDGPEDVFSGEIVVEGSRGVERTERDVRQGAGGLSVIARDPRAPIDWRRSFDPGLRLLRPEVNTWGEFEACWERTPGGDWRSLGAWGLGLACPDSPPDRAVGPPGWCASGLSQGTSVFVGRLAGTPNGAGEAWVRLVGFRP